MRIRDRVAGACAATSFLATASGIAASLCPTESVFGPIARMVDAYSPFLVFIGFLFALATVTLGGRAVGACLAFAAIVGSAQIYLSYRSLTIPVFHDTDPEVRILFFNALGGNMASSDRIVAAAMQADPDIIVFAEASAVVPSIEELRAGFDFVSPCTSETCELLVATNLNVTRFWQLQLNSVWAERYAVLEFTRPEGVPIFLAASHLAKPWLSGISESEIAKLEAQFNWLTGPVIALGDYNMAPWSLPMRRLLSNTGFQGLRWQFGTWPASASLFRIPIDQILVRGGVRVVKMTPFGEGLFSNHIGFIADISVLLPAE